MNKELEKKLTAELDKSYAAIMDEIPQLEIFGKTLVPISYLKDLLTRNISAQAAIQLTVPTDNTAPVTPDRLLDLLRFVLDTLQGNDSENETSEQEGEQNDE